MKSLAYSLKKSYFFIIFLFIILSFVSLIITGEYIINENKVKIRNAMSFLDYEIGDEKENKIDKIFSGDLVKNDFKKENISLQKMELIITYKNKIYAERKDKKFMDIDSTNKIEELDFYEYLVLAKYIKAKDGKNLKVTIVKSLKKEKKLFIKVMEIFIIGLIITIIISLIGIKYFLEKIKKQLKMLENLNESIDLNNLKLIKPKNKFLEFENICNSYVNMVERLDLQNQKQIEFVQSASHELKTPIFIIRGYIDMIKRWGKNDKKVMEESINFVEDEVKNMTELVEKLLFIAKDKEIKIENNDIELSEIICDIIHSFKKIFPQNEIIFNPKYTIINYDESLIKMLLKNIIENALKYGKNKPVKIEIKKVENKINLSVKDEGIGMSLKEIEHIFDRFYRVDKSRDKSIKGHGLGMTIVKRIISILKIELKIKSLQNKGTEIIIIFD